MNVQQDLHLAFDLRHAQQVPRLRSVAERRRVFDVPPEMFTTSATPSTTIAITSGPSWPRTLTTMMHVRCVYSTCSSENSPADRSPGSLSRGD